jgi:subtilisin family serine protease
MRFTHRLLIVVGLLAITIAGPAAADLRKLDARVRATAARLRAPISTVQPESGQLAASASGLLDVFIVGDVSRAELEALGVTVRTTVGDIRTAFVPVGAIEAVADLSRVRRIEAGAPVQEELNLSVPATNANNQRGPAPTFTGAAGQGVLVGVVDSGIDYSHSDFDDQAGNTRIVNLWDQSDPLGPTPNANGTATYAYGSDWSSADIDGNIAREVDTSTHGTHVAGIAAGDGSGTGGAVPAFTYTGMAPMADLCFVKTNFQTSGILDGVDYVKQRATALGMDAVVNLSLGSHFGPHDGTSAFESSLSALTGPGFVIVKSAGNERGVAQHAEVLAAGVGTNVTMNVAGSALNRVFAIDGYYNSTEAMNVRITTPGGTMIGPITLGNVNAAYPGTSTTNGLVYVENGVFLTSGNAREVYIEVNVTTGQNMNGLWTFTFIPVALGATNGEVDLWRFFVSSGASANFAAGNQATEELISEPGNAVELITTAAYVTKTSWIDCGGRNVGYVSPPAIGAIAPFSSPGPTRDGRQKPDIAAPGMGIGSTTSFDIAQVCPGTATNKLNDNMQHNIIEGTSMAAPHVTGAVAMILQRNPGFTPAQVKSYLNANALVDGQTGAVWNKDFGNGKLFLNGLLVDVHPLPGGASQFALSPARPNPTSGPIQLEFSLPREADVDLSVFDLQGRKVATLASGTRAAGRYQATWNPVQVHSGLYLVRYQGPGFNTTRRVVVTQ